jgi:bifunctional DNA-binding transcriptional regulator/antitoxin component of YhaV-PrlF toxin-antitoxin module
MLENTDFKSGDAFEMIVEEDQIILKKLPNGDE